MPLLVFLLWHKAVPQEGLGVRNTQSHWVLGTGSSPRGGQAWGQAPQGRDHGTEPAGVWEAFGRCSQTHSLIFVWSCVESRAGPDDPCGSLPTQDFLGFYDSCKVSTPGPMQCLGALGSWAAALVCVTGCCRLCRPAPSVQLVMLILMKKK